MQKLKEIEWSEKSAAHLLRRSAFSASVEEIRRCYKLGLEKSVSDILDGKMPGAPRTQSEGAILPKQLLPIPRSSLSEKSRGPKEDAMKDSRQILFTLQHHWLRRMYGANAPLEKLVLFWHGMLTSAYGKVTFASFMVRQNELLRKFALGDYRELVKRVVMDPAMIIYLDIDQNKRLQPNENFARELLELFTLGEGNYPPELIKVLAKEMVGYRVKKPENRIPIQSIDTKGMEANSGFSDKRRRLSKVVDSIFDLPVCGELLCRKLWKFYVADEEPSAETLYHLTKTLKKSNWQVTSVLREIFMSQEFFSESVIGQQIKSPVQFLLQSHRELGAVTVDLRSAYYAMQELGQSIFNPPNVAGWPGGQTWINGSTLSSRYALSSMMAKLIDKQLLETADYYLAKLKENRVIAVQEMVDYFFAVSLPINKMKVIIKLAAKTHNRDQAITLIEYLMCMPEYQLC